MGKAIFFIITSPLRLIRFALKLGKLAVLLGFLLIGSIVAVIGVGVYLAYSAIAG